MSFLNPTPSLPKFTGPFEVGSTEFEIPVSEIDAASVPPSPEITTVKFRLFCPTDAKPCKESISWVPGPQKQWIEAFSKFLGASLGWSSIVNPALSVLRLITIPAVPNAPVLRRKDGKQWPLLIFSHGLAGNCNAYSSLCGRLASCGIIVVAPEHRDGSAPITHIRTADGTPATTIMYQKYGYMPTTEVLNDRNRQLRIRMWELDLIYASLMKLNKGEQLSNYALPKPSSSPQTSLANTMDFQPGHVSWVGHSFGAATMAQFVKSVYYYHCQPSLKGTRYEDDEDWRPLFTPSSHREILSQIRPSSPVSLLDVWTLPFYAPSTHWLWERPLPCYDRVRRLDEDERPTTLSVISTEFFNWEALRHRTCALLSREPVDALRRIEEDKAMSRATTPHMEETHPSPRISTPPYRGAEQALAMAPTIETAYESLPSLPPPSLSLDPGPDSDTYTLSCSTSETNSYTPASLFSKIGDSAASSHTDLSTSLDAPSSSYNSQDGDGAGLCTPTAALKPSLTVGVSPRLFYIPYSAHLSQSDFALLFPRMLRFLMKAVDAELIMRLNVRAVMQTMRNAGLQVESVEDKQRKRWLRWASSSSSSKWSKWSTWATNASTTSVATASTAVVAASGRTAAIRSSDDILLSESARWKRLDVLT